MTRVTDVLSSFYLIFVTVAASMFKQHFNAVVDGGKANLIHKKSRNFILHSICQIR